MDRTLRLTPFLSSRASCDRCVQVVADRDQIENVDRTIGVDVRRKVAGAHRLMRVVPHDHQVEDVDRLAAGIELTAGAYLTEEKARRFKEEILDLKHKYK